MNKRLCCVVLWAALGCNEDVKIDDEENVTGSGGSSGDEGSGSDGESDSSCAEDAACGTGQICEAGECVDGDRNNSVDEAESLLFTDSSDESARTVGVLNPAYDRDYYVLQADGGEFVRITTYTDEEDETKDTVVTLLQDNGKVITLANGHAAGSGVGDADSVVYGYLPTEGTYYVLVEDDATFFGEGEPEGGRDYIYELQMSTWVRRTFEPDSFGDPNESIDMSSASSWFARGVILEEAGDVDYISLDYQLDGHDLFLDGNYDLQGSDADPRVRLLDATTGEVLRTSVKRPSRFGVVPKPAAG